MTSGNMSSWMSSELNKLRVDVIIIMANYVALCTLLSFNCLLKVKKNHWNTYELHSHTAEKKTTSIKHHPGI